MNKISRELFEWSKQKHYELWDWLAKNPDKEKKEWEGFKYIEKSINSRCFACYLEFKLYFLNLGTPTQACMYCPIKENICCEGGLYLNWADSDDAAERTRLAEQIRDLEWSEEYVEVKE